MMLQLEKIKKDFIKEKSIVSIIKETTISFETHLNYALTGPSGSGKSTLMHIISGIDSPTEGTVTFDGKDVRLFSDQERAKNIVLITQYPFLIKELSLIENVCLAAILTGADPGMVKQEALFYIKKVGLYDMQNESVGALSGGQRQRVALARALLVKPHFICADEITGSLDEKTGKEVFSFLKDHCKKEKIGLIVSSHNPAIIKEMQIVFALKDGILSNQYSSFTGEMVRERSFL